MPVVEEKRRAKRYICQVPVECKKGSSFDSSQTFDISKGGLGLISSKPIPRHTKMIVEIAMSPKSDPVLAVGQVKWVRKIPVSNNYRLGMHFSPTPESSKEIDWFSGSGFRPPKERRNYK